MWCLGLGDVDRTLAVGPARFWNVDLMEEDVLAYVRLVFPSDHDCKVSPADGFVAVALLVATFTSGEDIDTRL